MVVSWASAATEETLLKQRQVKSMDGVVGNAFFQRGTSRQVAILCPGVRQTGGGADKAERGNWKDMMVK